MVLRADDRLVPEFLKALEENGQKFIADMLLEPGELFRGTLRDVSKVNKPFLERFIMPN